jgi:hypothetical protein
MMIPMLTLPPSQMTEAELIVALRACEVYLRDFKPVWFDDHRRIAIADRRARELRAELESRSSSACL